MSYILDALKRSEQERRRAEPLASLGALVPEPAQQRPWLGYALAAIVVANLAIAGTLFWPEPVPEQVSAPVVPTATPIPQPAEETAAGESGSLAQLAGSDRQADFGAAPQPTLSAEPRAAAAPAQSAPAPDRAPVAAAQPATADTPPPLLSQLPSQFRAGLPDYAVNVHVYTEAPESRFVLINLKRYREGAALAGGGRLLEITPHGLVIEHQGRRFRLDAR